MMTENKNLQKVLKNLPKAPGVYKMIDKEGRVIYVGKAKDVSKRIKQYFQKNYEHSTRTRKLLENVTNIETIIVDSELEAVILEHNLIKQLQPKYNVIMKDDKNYVYIKITLEDFPRVQIVSRIEKDNAKYIGPKTAAHKVQETFKILKKIFPFRHCGLDIKIIKDNEVEITNKVIKYPCLDYYIKRCIAPCIGKCSIKEYQKIIKNVENFLEGKTENILKDLKRQMQEYSAAKNFEKAAKIRDKLLKIEEIVERQKVQDQNQEDKDVINYCVSQDRAYFNLFQIRDGKLIGQENFTLSATDID
ncbi:MAG: excinuclease ABC subunit UvrC, partial [Patescibacteria group bacterium]